MAIYSDAHYVRWFARFTGIVGISSHYIIQKFHFFLFYIQLSANKFEDTKRLQDDLMTSYNIDVRPMWDDDDVTKVAISFALIDVEDIMESGHIKSRMWIRMVRPLGRSRIMLYVVVNVPYDKHCE